MPCLTMHYPLTLAAIERRAATFFGHKEVVTERPDGTRLRSTYRDVLDRAHRLAAALQALGVGPGDRVATLGWNHQQHLEAYYGITSAGAVLLTLNLRLHPSDLEYIIRHASAKVVLVDANLWHLLEGIQSRLDGTKFITMARTGPAEDGRLDYEKLVSQHSPAAFHAPDLEEDQPAAMCYTSGTTGMPKGVLYSHRALVLHSMTLAMTDCFGLGEADVVLPLVPMFHANAWGLPFACALTGAKQVLTGPHMDMPRFLQLLADEKATISAGVPTIWLAALQHLDQQPGRYDLSRLRKIIIGGSAVPRGLIQGMQERHGLPILQIWGMTEMAPIGTVATLPSHLCEQPLSEQYAYRARQGTPVPFIEIRARGAQGLVPWDGKSSGELEVRGPWVASAYYESPEASAAFTADGWFRTGDIVCIDSHGCIEIQDRAKDVIKSGGEWISSVALENALMNHPAVAEAAVVAVAHPKWQERPLAAVVLKEGSTATEAELRDHLAPQFAKWWLPDAIVFVREIPRTSAGKFLKKRLREMYHDYLLKNDSAPES